MNKTSLIIFSIKFIKIPKQLKYLNTIFKNLPYWKGSKGNKLKTEINDKKKVIIKFFLFINDEIYNKFKLIIIAFSWTWNPNKKNIRDCNPQI